MPEDSSKALKEKGRIVAGIIKKAFLSNSELISPNKRSHLAIRLFRISGNPEHNHFISENFDVLKENLLNDIRMYGDEEYVQKRAEVFFTELGKNNDRKGVERQKAFSARKESLFYFRVIESSHIWNEMGFLQAENQQAYQIWLEHLKTKDLKSMAFDDEVFRNYSTQLVNVVYHLRSNNVVDITAELAKKFLEVFSDEAQLDDYMYRNKIYTMTHIILCASRYYQNFVSSDDFRWVIEYFKNNIEQIIARTNADIAGEVGLCFRLAGINSGREIELIAEHILKQFDAEKGYIPRMSGDHQSSEHANAVAYMFLTGFEELHPGPFFDSRA